MSKYDQETIDKLTRGANMAAQDAGSDPATVFKRTRDAVHTLAQQLGVEVADKDAVSTRAVQCALRDVRAMRWSLFWYDPKGMYREMRDVAFASAENVIARSGVWAPGPDRAHQAAQVIAQSVAKTVLQEEAVKYALRILEDIDEEDAV